VFINNRELHPVDIVAIQSTTGLLVPCVPSRWWQDAYGNLGLEGNPTPVQNLFYPQMVAATPPTQPSMLPVDQLHAPPYAVASVVVPSSYVLSLSLFLPASIAMVIHHTFECVHRQ